MNQDITPDIQRQANIERVTRIDHLFEIGLVLVTLLFGAELQYVSVQIEFQEAATKSMVDVNFTFRVFSILLGILILLWITKELIPFARGQIIFRNFCWGLLSMIFALEGFAANKPKKCLFFDFKD
jgi:hypothetical protein